MQISLFHGARDNVPKQVTLSWERFCELLLPHEFRPQGTKADCDAFCPATFREGGSRCDGDAESLSMFVADLDEVTEEQLEAFVEKALSRGWAMLLYTTWRQHVSPHRLRAVLPFSDPVPVSSWQATWLTMNKLLGSCCDSRCANPSRVYFGAYAPDLPEAREAVFSHVFEGRPVDLDELDLACVSEPELLRDEQISREQLQQYASMLARKRDEESPYLAKLLRKIVQGESFARPGERDNTIFKLACLLAKRWPLADAESLAAHFASSLQLMSLEGDDCPDVDLVSYKISRAQDRILEQRREVEEAANESLRLRILDAFGTGRDQPYVEEELKDLPPNRWMIQRGRSFYTWVLGRYYGPYVMEEAANAAYRDLAPAHGSGVELCTVSAQGAVRYKSPAELVREYGTTANDVAIDLTASKSYFDEETKTVVEACCPLRDIEPAYHEDVARWLEALAGDRLHLLLSWLAAMTFLNKPCTALLLTGARHTGKSLLPDGLSRLWTTIGGPTPLADVLGTSFNDAQLHCPLIFGDERLPTDYRGRVLYSELREYIQSRRRPIKRKFLPPAQMVGAVRVIVSANSEDILSTAENLSSEDIGAIADRWLHIPCGLDAFRYLQAVDTSDWVDGDKIAAHALYLKNNYEWQPNGRFLVHGDDKDFHSRLVSRVGVRSAVLQFLVAYLLDPERLDNDPRAAWWVRINKHRLCVNIRGMVACWSHYVSNEKCPPTGYLSRGLSTLCKNSRARLTLPDGKRVAYRIVDNEHLIAWAEDKDYAAKDEIEEALRISTEERMKGNQLRAVQ